jgi:GTP-binding protein HflX
MPKPQYYETQTHPNVLLVGVHAPSNRTGNIESYHEEFINLVQSCGIPYVAETFIRLRAIDSGYFLSKGKLSEIKDLCEKNAIEMVIFSDMLTPQQERNLSDYLDCELMDRTGLILKIFEAAAHSAEGKIQVAMAMLQFEKTRLAGKGIHLEQQAGHRGVRGGAGETKFEIERRQIEQQMVKLKKQLEKMQQARDTQRKQRLNAKEPMICLVGYTNAGKSTILNALTKSDVYAANKLFATLDTTIRALYIDGKKKGVISDTVGFIQNLPPHLIEAFKSTLSELQYADLLMHVVDLADVNWASHIHVVNEILGELELESKPVVYVFNKADKVENIDALAPRLERYQPHVIVSAHTKAGIKPLVEFIHDWKPTFIN